MKLLKRILLVSIIGILSSCVGQEKEKYVYLAGARLYRVPKASQV